MVSLPVTYLALTNSHSYPLLPVGPVLALAMQDFDSVARLGLGLGLGTYVTRTRTQFLNPRTRT